MKYVPFPAYLFLALPVCAATGSNIAVDSQGSIWSTGQNLPVALTPNAFQKTQGLSACATQQLSPFDLPTFVPCSHAYVMKKDANGNILYATYLGGSSQDGGIAITTDAQGNAYVTGFTYSADFPVTAGVVQPHNAGPVKPKVVLEALGPFGPVNILPGGDTFIAKFAPGGALLYSTLLGGSGSDVPALIAVDSSGAVFVAGTTSSTDFPVTPDAMSNQSNPGAFFVRMNPPATALVYSTYSGSTIGAFDTDSQGDAFFTGSSQPPGFSAGPYVTKVDTSTGRVLYSRFLPGLNPKLAGSGAAIAVTASGTALVGVSPAPMPSRLLIPEPPVYALGPSFLLTLSADGTGIPAETDIGTAQFDGLLQDAAGNAYAFGHGTGALPAAPSPPLLSAPCSSLGGEFVIELNAAGSVAAASYLRQGSSSVAAIGAFGQLSVYRAASQTMTPVALGTVPSMNFGCLENLASGEVGPGIAPGEIFALFGNNLGPAQAVAGAPNALGQYPVSISGVQVLINGTAAPLLLVQAGEIHGVVPFGFSPPVATIEVQYLNQSAPMLDAPTSANPGIFTINGQGAIVNQDGTVNAASNPAQQGSIVSIYATGTGPLASPIADGEITPIPPPYIVVASTPQVIFAGIAGNVLWAGSAPGLIAGVTQINVQLPASLPAGTNLAAVPVVVISPGVFSPPAAISVAK
jgi:uncharacterized protein (TIGR03437 family)